jgi:4'-phosphopantetheinyl transferase
VIFSRLRRFCQLPTLAAVRLVEVFQVVLDRPADIVAARADILAPDERERAARLRDPGPWTVARGTLRELLGERLGTAPAAVTLAAGPHGKPEVPGAALRFNVSHTRSLALIALAEGFEVGVDVERLDRRSRAVERTLTPAEAAALGRAGDRHAELLRIWCRKEALAKALGGGLGWEPLRFDTTAPGALWLADVPVAAGHVAALACTGGPAAVSVQWRGEAGEPPAG